MYANRPARCIRATLSIGSHHQELNVTTSSVTSRPDTLLQALCVIVILAIVIAVVYAAWIGISNFSRIGV